MSEFANRLLGLIRTTLRQSHTTEFDEEIKSYIDTAAADLQDAGILSFYFDTSNPAWYQDPRILQAVRWYCLSVFGLYNSDMEKYDAAYRSLKSTLASQEKYSKDYTKEEDNIIKRILDKLEEAIQKLEQETQDSIEKLEADIDVVLEELQISYGEYVEKLNSSTEESIKKLEEDSSKLVEESLEELKEGVSDIAVEEAGKYMEDLSGSIEAVENTLLQSGMTEKISTESSYNERVTADGARVVDGSKAKLHKVVGNTAKSENLFDGNLENGYYSDANWGMGGKSTNNYRSLMINLSAGTYCLQFSCEIMLLRTLVDGGYVQSASLLRTTTFTTNGGKVGFSFQRADRNEWSDDCLVWITEGTEAKPYTPYFIKSATFGGIKSTSLNGEESVLSFPKTELPNGAMLDFDRQVIVNANGTETPFTEEMEFAGKEYQVWQGGTETVLGNDGAEKGAKLTLSQGYTIVNEIGQGGGGGEGGDVDLKDYQKKIDYDLQTTNKTIVGAINEVNAKAGQGGSGSGGNVNLTDYQKKQDNTLNTTSKLVVGAINEVNTKVDNIPSWAKQSTKPTYSYTEISGRLQIGTSSGTAYDGAKGNQNASAISTLRTNVSNLQTSVNGKQDKLTAGDNITIQNGVISATGSGSEGGLGEASVRAIAQEEAGTALTVAKAYTDEKLGDIETALTEILGV